MNKKSAPKFQVKQLEKSGGKTTNKRVREANKIPSVQISDNGDKVSFTETTETQEIEVLKAKYKISIQRTASLMLAYKNFVDLVDECLLLDEDLADAWEHLRNGVITSRKILGDE